MLVFRYDNVAHYPAISTFPHHKHVGARTGDSQTVIATLPPSLTDVLQEIDAYLYGSQEPQLCAARDPRDSAAAGAQPAAGTQLRGAEGVQPRNVGSETGDGWVDADMLDGSCTVFGDAAVSAVEMLA